MKKPALRSGLNTKQAECSACFFMAQRPSETISDGLLFLMMGCLKIIVENGSSYLKLRFRPIGAIVLPIDFDKRNFAIIAQPRFGACGVMDNGRNGVGFGEYFAEVSFLEVFDCAGLEVPRFF